MQVKSEKIELSSFIKLCLIYPFFLLEQFLLINFQAVFELFRADIWYFYMISGYGFIYRNPQDTTQQEVLLGTQ